ncbi:MAG: aminotransferase class I/II-fold pyridoxal phosphate-dependent enzyme [Candidatus Eremiobacteraeota bacterium]|nr:aminotransferase class I/II-fold pyridoxal phosphate-dependent enzyme [Candidatus Eremiobacteraeota bacterium]
MSYLKRVEARLAEIATAHRTRTVEPWQPRGVIDFSSNDYLALATDPQVVAAFRQAKRVGAGGARLLGGRHREHSLLEEELALWLGRERALIFSSGYLAALGSIAVLGSVVERIASDRLNHASLIDGIRATGLPRTIFPHAQPPPGDGTPTLYVSESLFSMDGDTIDPARMLVALGPDDVLLLDEAHALGVYGAEGAGLAYDLRDDRVVILGTLSKALGAQGGFIAGPARSIDLIANAARPFIFDTALPPSIALAARVALVLARKADDRRAHLRELAVRLRAGLQTHEIASGGQAASPIVPILIGDEEATLLTARLLLAKNIYAPAIRPPTVPRDTSRIRVSLRSDIRVEDIDALLREVSRATSVERL